MCTVLQQLVREWQAQHHPPPNVDKLPMYLFRSRAHPDLPVSTSHVRRTFMAIARRAGVHGPHVHPDTTRHTPRPPPSEWGTVSLAWTLWDRDPSVSLTDGWQMGPV